MTLTITQLPVTVEQHFARYAANRSQKNLDRVRRAVIAAIVDEIANTGQDRDALAQSISENYGRIIRSVIAHPSAKAHNLVGTMNRIIVQDKA